MLATSHMASQSVCTVQASSQAAVIRLPRPDRAGKGPRSRHRDRASGGNSLRIAAKVDRVDEAYFREAIAPLLDDPGVEFIGEINERQKTGFLSEARALLFPVSWPEPFGLVMIEAMACGTPVLAFRCGSVPEIVEDGVTGAIVDTVDEAIAALPHVIALDRQEVRRRFEQRFSASRMAKAYVGIYQSLIASSQPIGEAEDAIRLPLTNGNAANAGLSPA
jgi:glycosyltransferase involved in cell wall biosynthesis